MNIKENKNTNSTKKYPYEQFRKFWDIETGGTRFLGL